MPQDRTAILLKSCREAAFAAAEKGLRGPTADAAVLKAAAKVASRILGCPVEVRDVVAAVQGGE